MPVGKSNGPITAVFDVYDASQKSTRERIRWFAEGHAAEDIGMNWERYYRTMPNYMRYVSYEIVWKLFNRLKADSSRQEAPVDEKPDGRRGRDLYKR